MYVYTLQSNDQSVFYLRKSMRVRSADTQTDDNQFILHFATDLSSYNLLCEINESNQNVSRPVPVWVILWDEKLRNERTDMNEFSSLNLFALRCLSVRFSFRIRFSSSRFLIAFFFCHSFSRNFFVSVSAPLSFWQATTTQHRTIAESQEVWIVFIVFMKKLLVCALYYTFIVIY